MHCGDRKRGVLNCATDVANVLLHFFCCVGSSLASYLFPSASLLVYPSPLKLIEVFAQVSSGKVNGKCGSKC